jgi:hypothetical protein
MEGTRAVRGLLEATRAVCGVKGTRAARRERAMARAPALRP